MVVRVLFAARACVVAGGQLLAALSERESHALVELGHRGLCHG